VTDPHYTALCVIVDRSGSMDAIRDAAQDSINEFIGAQRRRPGRTTLRIVQFDAPEDPGARLADADVIDDGAVDDWYLVHCPSIPAADVPLFELHPRGMTALYDAIGRGVDEFGAELAALPEAQRPGTVIFAILTDGLENASKRETAKSVRERVTHQQEAYGWTFIYLGANQDAILEGAKLGVPARTSLTYTASSGGTRSTVESLGEVVAAAAAGEEAAFSDAQREGARTR
jgi:hypothetical protein